MNGNLIRTLGIGFAVVVLLIIGVRLLGIFQYYNIPTPSNEPALSVGSRIVASNQKKPALYDLICYKRSFNGQESIYVHRLCGMPGDEIEMRDGIFYSNGKNFDESLNLKHSYMIDRKTADYLKEEKMIDEDDLAAAGTVDSMFAFIEDKIIDQEKITSTRIIQKRRFGLYKADFVFSQDSGTIDNFGPYTVPAGNYFVMGDNRHNSLDSRYTGYVSADEWVGTVLFK